MPYYQSVEHINFPAHLSSDVVVKQTPQDLFFERGFRTRPRATGISTLIPGSAAEPYSWLDANNSIKAQNFRSAHPELASLFKKDKGHSWYLATCKVSGTPWTARSNFRLAPYQSWSNLLFDYYNLSSLTGGNHAPFTFLGTDVELSNYAALEYGKTAPTSDQFSASAFIGELREGLPALIPVLIQTGPKLAFRDTLKKQAKRAKDAGSDYLNVQFGWIPLLNDVRKIATALAVATTAVTGQSISTHRRREGRVRDIAVSGNFALPNCVVSAELSAAQWGISSTWRGGGPYGVFGSIWQSQKHTIDYSFEAEFLRLPEGSKDYSVYTDKLSELMRWDLRPSDLWQLAPWSWLVDWFTDIGGQLESWESATSNRILSLYAYGMRDERKLSTSVASVSSGGNYTPYFTTYFGPSSVFQQIEIRRRQRIKANPFGYVLNPLSQLTAGQLAILGALGLTKTKR